MRGRLINPFLAKIARIDTDATAADPDGAGELVSGYDDTFREPIPNNPLAPTDRAVVEQTAILVPCQFEPEDQFELLQQAAAGDDSGSRVRVIVHVQDLEEAGLVDETTGDALFRKNDRLLAIHRFSDEGLIQRCGTEGRGLYCTEVKPVSFGLSGGERNLLICTFMDRQESFKAGG